MGRFQRGWLKLEQRKAGQTWVLRYNVSRERDGKIVRVENKLPIGLLKDLPTERDVWAEVERLHLNLNQPDFKGRVMFADIARHYEEHELGEQTDSVDPKSHTTIAAYKRVLRNRCIPQWGKKVALSLEPMDIQNWLLALRRGGLANPTVDKTRRVMSLVFKHAQRYGLIPRTHEANPMMFVRCKTVSDYEAMTITPEQAFKIMLKLPEPERVLTLLAAATGLRISECLGLQWADVDFVNKVIYIRRTWTCGQVGKPKSKASKASVPLHDLLADFLLGWKQQTPYSAGTDWVFPSFKLKGKQPRVGNMLVEDYLRPAAVEVGVLKGKMVDGKLVDDDPRRFGFHNFRHSLASFLVAQQHDPKTVQSLLRHADVKTTLGIYAHANSEQKLAAQGQMLRAILEQPSTVQ